MIDHVLAVVERNLGYAQALLADVPDDRMCEQPAGYPNHPAWQIGHITLTCDFVGGMLGLDPALPAAWKDLFGMGTPPTGDPPAYPSKSELTEAFQSSHARFCDALRAADASSLASPVPDEMLRNLFPSIGAAAIGVLTAHQAVHLGQLSAWRKLAGFPSAFGI